MSEARDPHPGGTEHGTGASAPVDRMRAVSEQEYRAELEGGFVPDPAPAGPGVTVLPQSTGSAHPPRYTLSYVIEDSDSGIHVVDPGLDDAEGENLARLETHLARSGRRLDEIASVTVTHLHADHLGLGERLQRDHGVPVAMHRVEQLALRTMSAQAESMREGFAAQIASWGVPEERRAELLATGEVMARSGVRRREPFDAAVLLDDGDVLPISGRALRVLPTPGHTPGHIALVDDAGLVFTGDHLLPAIFPGIGLGGPTPDPLGDYLRSLDTLSPYAAHTALPGHGYRFTGLADRIAVTREHHLRRSREIAALLVERPRATTWQLAEGIHWTAGFTNLADFYLVSALSQTAMHVAYLERNTSG